MDQRYQVSGGALVVVLLVAIVLAIIQYRRSRHERAINRVFNIAHIIEQADVTLGGRLAIALLIIWNVLAILTMASSTVLQATVYAIIWIGGNQLLIFCVSVGTRRNYVVRKPADEGKAPT